MTTPAHGGGERSAVAARRVIAYITATRAEYGLARRSLLGIDHAADLDLRLVVTGDHLDDARGATLAEITEDGLAPAAVLPLPTPQDGPLGAALWIASCLPAFTATLLELRPDALLVIGDRFEALAAAQAAALCGVPVAHVHGGEVTSGSLDDAMRHAITKFARLHLTAAPEYARRVIQLGEDPATVQVVGAPGTDGIGEEDTTAADILAELGLDPELSFVLVTYHPATAAPATQTQKGAQAIIDALDLLSPLQAVITGVNSDPGNATIRSLFTTYAAAHPERVVFVESLGHIRYQAMLRSTVACLGNSSSGLIEAPAAGAPTVNVGPRQDGRLRAPSVLDVAEDADAIAVALRAARRFDPLLATDEPVAERIVTALRTWDLTDQAPKGFHDCGPLCDSWRALGGIDA